ncbi:hypothetical protein GDO78_005134 [Eleutherodactylus coqui]|uniref:Uncharacterized protein n=1 Tax=Eleutherodactylus coqui TaxID=57060 RepID=A0A8J6KE68_ELECQ|nr:hypothetical protein GDO78_005134 [Eleutherodactylus coqui]
MKHAKMPAARGNGSGWPLTLAKVCSLQKSTIGNIISLCTVMGGWFCTSQSVPFHCDPKEELQSHVSTNRSSVIIWLEVDKM